MDGRKRPKPHCLEASLKKSMVLKRWPVLVGLAAFAGVAYAATTVTIGINSPIALSTGGNGDKPKIQRNGSGLLVTA